MASAGHSVGLNLKRPRDYTDGDLAPLTIDGVSFRHVGDIKIDASPTGAMKVTVTFDACEIRGVDDELDNWVAGVEHKRLAQALREAERHEPLDTEGGIVQLSSKVANEIADLLDPR